MPKPPPITEAEWTVMNVLWDDSPSSAQDVHERVDRRRDWSLGTVKTLLSRLTKKGAVKHTQSGKRFLYSPAFTKSACIKAAGKELLDRAGRDAHSPLLAFFLSNGRIDQDEIQELRELLDRLEERGR